MLAEQEEKGQNSIIAPYIIIGMSMVPSIIDIQVNSKSGELAYKDGIKRKGQKIGMGYISMINEQI